MGRERNKAVGRDLMAKESDLLLSKQAFVRIDVEAILCQDGKDCSRWTRCSERDLLKMRRSSK